MSLDALQTRPKVRYVCDELEKLALELGPGAQLPTMVQLRDSLGVSMKTLHDSLRQMESRNILRSIHGVGIFVENPQKRVLTGNLGFLVAAQQSAVQSLAYFGLIIAGIRQEAALHQKDVVLLDNDSPVQNWEKLDGVIVSELRDPRDGPYGLQSIPEAMPKVAILNKLPGMTSVYSDDYQGVKLLTQRLISQGHRRIAYLAAHCPDIFAIAARRKGYLEALEEAGIEFNPLWTRELRYREAWSSPLDWSFQGGQAHMTEWLSAGWRELGCTALIAQNDESAFGAISAFARAGYHVPGDVSVTGYDGIPNGNDLLPSLTTVRVPLSDIGRQAARLLTQDTGTLQAPATDLVLPVQLVPGSTSASPRSRG